MTEDQVVNLVSKWQTRLKLDHWDIEVEVLPSEKINDKGGDVVVDFQYLTASIRIANMADGTVRDRFIITQNIVHELLHCHTAGFNIPIGTKEHTAEEQMNQVLSRVLIEAYNK